MQLQRLSQVVGYWNKLLSMQHHNQLMVAATVRLLLALARNDGSGGGRMRQALERSPVDTLCYAGIGPNMTPQLWGGHPTVAKHTKQFRAAAEERIVPALKVGSRHDVVNQAACWAQQLQLPPKGMHLLLRPGAATAQPGAPAHKAAAAGASSRLANRLCGVPLFCSHLSPAHTRTAHSPLVARCTPPVTTCHHVAAASCQSL